MSGPLMEFTSHIEGRNAKVAIYDDRIEWGRERVTLSGRRRDTNMIPVRQIQGVTTHRAGMLYTVVKVATAADTIEFRVSKPQAEEFKATITRLMLGGIRHLAQQLPCRLLRLWPTNWPSWCSCAKLEPSRTRSSLLRRRSCSDHDSGTFLPTAAPMTSRKALRVL